MLVALKVPLGASLIEMMITMTLGLVSLSTVASLVGYGVGVNAKLLENSRLSQEVMAIGSLLSRDLRRAGYSASTAAMVSDPTNFPSVFSNSIAVSAYPDEASNSCIVFAYDRNGNGILDTIDGNENFGFRLKDGAVEIRIDGASCVDNGWENLSDDQVLEITQLTFVLNQTIDNAVVSTWLSISLQGELSKNNQLSRQFTSSFMVRNYD
ncbi:MAG: prepilin peptidase dependent protein B [Paraglaciecola sp.]|jgi:prepilin peptidase dependent protein B